MVRSINHKNRNRRHRVWRTDLLEGKNVSLRRAEKDVVPLLAGWLNSVRFVGPYSDFPTQVSEAELERRMFEPKLPQMEWVDFIVQNRAGASIGWVVHYISSQNFGWVEIGYYLVPEERGKGYGTEAVGILMDYLFLAKDVPRVQAVTSVENKASQRVLKKSGFRREGIVRRGLWTGKGKWTDGMLFSILREEWKEPKILTRSSSEK